VRFDIGPHHVRIELLSEVEDVMVDSEAVCDSPGVDDIGDRATARVGCTSPKLHRGAHDFVPFVLQQPGRHRGIDSAGEGYEDTHEYSFSDGGTG
jgi:hypothetical protein